MAKYTIQPNQNLFDVALHLYGSIEGLFDILISNPQINMTSDLMPGMELEYHDSFVIHPDVVNRINLQSIIPANGEREVYYNHTDKPLRFICYIDPTEDFTSFKIAGEGKMIIDWGDNNSLETFILSHTPFTLEHYFNNVIDDVRCVRIYGEFALTELNTTKSKGGFLSIRPTVVDEYTDNSNENDLRGLFLFERTFKVNLQNRPIDSLSPIQDMSLQELDLRGAKFDKLDVLDDYLEYLANNYGSRRACTILLNTQPSKRGMDAINKIITEPEWNTPTTWKFIINDKTYTA